jgi:hypothetical protein
MSTRFARLWLAVPTALAVVGSVQAGHAGLIAHYTFNDGTADDLTDNYELTTVTNGTGVSYGSEGTTGFASFPGDDANLDYLENTTGPGDDLTGWTLSVWYRPTGGVENAANQAIYSNDNDFNEAGSFQLDVHNGTRRVNSKDAGQPTFGSPTDNTWENIVLRKASDTDFRIYVNGVQQGSTITSNIGGLEQIRIGTNRGTGAGLRMDVDEVKIWDSAEDASTIYSAGPTPIPEPSTLALTTLGLLGLAFFYRRRRK